MALNNRQLRAIEMLVTTAMRKQDIAKEVGVSPATMSTWLKKDEFQQGIREEMQRCFAESAYKARRKLDLLIDSSNEGIALAASREVLNKAGYMETQKVEQTVKEITIEVTD